MPPRGRHPAWPHEDVGSISAAIWKHWRAWQKRKIKTSSEAGEIGLRCPYRNLILSPMIAAYYGWILRPNLQSGNLYMGYHAEGLFCFDEYPYVLEECGLKFNLRGNAFTMKILPLPSSQISCRARRQDANAQRRRLHLCD